MRVSSADIQALAREQGLGEEDCGRRERYAFFEALRQELGGEAVVATAHTLSDQLETLLFRMARGTGLSGLCGIPEKRENVVRPLLSCTRQEVEGYCARKGIPYRTDSTNGDPRYARNRLRLEAVPALKAVNPEAERHCGQLAKSLALDRDFLEGEAGKLLSRCQAGEALLLAPLKEAHPALSLRAAELWLDRRGLFADYPLLSQIGALVQRGQGKINLPGGKWLSAHQGKLFLERPEDSLPPDSFRAEVDLAGEKEGLLAWIALPEGTAIGVYRLPAKKNKKIYNSDLIFSLDYDTIVGNVIFRRHRAGDRLRLPGRGCSRPLKKLYSESGLSLRERRAALVAEDSRGLLWAEHVGKAERPSLSGETQLLVFLREDNREGDDKDDNAGGY